MATEPNFEAQVAERASPKAIARQLLTAGRVLAGFLFFVFGLNGLLSLLPHTASVAPYGLVAFGVGVTTEGVIQGGEVLVGALLLVNRFVPVAIALIAAIVLHLFTSYVCLTPSAMGLGAMLGLGVGAAWSYCKLDRPSPEARGAGSEPETARNVEISG